MADYLKALVVPLKLAEPATARVGVRAAHQQREAIAPACLGSLEVGRIELSFTSLRSCHRFRGRLEQVEQVVLQTSVDVVCGDVVDDDFLESLAHGRYSVVDTDDMNAQFGEITKRLQTAVSCEKEGDWRWGNRSTGTTA